MLKMIGFALSMTLGSVVMLHLPGIPVPALLCTLVPAAVYGVSSSSLRPLSGFVLGLWLTATTVSLEVDRRLPASAAPNRVLTGVVTGLPRLIEGVHRFKFKVTEGDLAGREFRLSWRAPDVDLVPGQRWRLGVRIKSPSGSLNFGIFDYEGWLFLKRIHGSGYVLATPAAVMIDENGGRLLDRLRFSFRQELLGAVPRASVGTFLALTLGDTSGLDHAHWDILNRTGTTHLLIVSGLHIGLVATICFAIFRLAGLGLFPVIFLTAILTGGYALLAGWGLPVQRAYTMALVFLSCLFFSRQLALQTQLALAGVVVIILDPLASLGSGFWFSFGAVSVLVLALSGRVTHHKGLKMWLASTLAAQWVVYLCLLPVLGYTNHQLPLGSFLVNLIAIPAIGMLLVPMLLFSSMVLSVYPSAGHGLLELCGLFSSALWQFLDAASGLDLVMGVGEFSLVACLVSLLGAGILLTPQGLLPRWPGVILVLAIMAPDKELEDGDLRVTFLDVGQGLSVLMESRERFQLYDTGPTFGTTFSAAKQLVIPSLRRSGGGYIDHLIISHKDNDHAGGMTDILSAVHVGRVILYGDCNRTWTVDQVTFRTFSAGLNRPGGRVSENDRSCLLAARAHSFDILLTGDIEADAEYLLLDSSLGTVDVMSVPHHGSNSSSTPALLNRLMPDIAVVSSGFRNRFNHPDPVIHQRYAGRAVMVLNTATSGAVEVLVTKHGVQVMEARKMNRKIWRR